MSLFFILFENFYDSLCDADLLECFFVFFERLVDIFNGSEILYQNRGSFLSDARHADDVIRRIATEAFVIRQKLRRKAESIDNSFFVVHDCVVDSLFKGIDLNFFAVDQLQCVHIARRNDDFFILFFLELLHNRAQHVISLKAGMIIHRNIEALKNIPRSLELRDERIIRFFPSGLIFAVCFVPECFSRQVIACRDVIRLQICDDLHQHCGDAIQRACRLALARREFRQRMICAVDDGMRIQKHETFFLLFFFRKFFLGHNQDKYIILK